MVDRAEMTHGQISEALSLTEDFFARNGPSPESLIVEPLILLSERLHEVQGYKGLLGVGYPFYATPADTGETLPVPSIASYLEDMKKRVQESSEQHGEYWPCADCQVDNKLPNLTDQCVPCDLVAFKPRDLFRALPDMDAIAIFEESSHEIEEHIQNVLIEMGWIRFNTDIQGAFDGTVNALSSDTSAKLPIDFHVLSYDQLAESFQKIIANPLEEQVGARSRAWRARWKDQPIDMSYSFAFSMTELGRSSSDLSQLMQHIRKDLLALYTVDDIANMVQRSRRCGPILSDIALRNTLQKRLQGWE